MSLAEGLIDSLDDLTIHERMVAILGELPAIGKDAFNEQQKFHFRSHDSVLNALNPLLAKWGVYVVPFVQERVTGERKTRSGGTMYEVNLLVRYTFYGLKGDSFVASAWGEGTDSGDKATNKAMTMAFKNVLAQSFAVSTADTVDSDGQTPEETTGRSKQELRELEALIEEVKAADQDPAHGGGYYYQVAVNAAAKYHHKKLDELAPGEIADLEQRFAGLLRDLTKTDPDSPAEAELPVKETEVRKGPEPVSLPGSWAEIEQAIRVYGADTWADFYEFMMQAQKHLFPDAQRMSQQRKDVLFQKVSAVMIALRETHDPGEFPPPSRLEFQAHWSKVLDGTVLDGPAWAMDPNEAKTSRPPRKQPAGDKPPTPEPPAGTDSEGVAEVAAEPASPAAPSPPPSEETFTDGVLTDAEQEVLNAIDEEFPGAERVDGG